MDSTYNHNHRPSHDNRAEEDSWPDLADQDGHRWLEYDIGNEEHEDDNRLDEDVSVSAPISKYNTENINDTHITISNTQCQLFFQTETPITSSLVLSGPVQASTLGGYTAHTPQSPPHSDSSDPSAKYNTQDPS